MKLPLISLLVVAGCVDARTYTDVATTKGRVCVRPLPPPSDPLSFQIDHPVVVEYTADECLGGCTQRVAASLTVARGAPGFDVHGEASWTEVSGRDLVCPAVCVAAQATAMTPPLSEGEHTFVFGDAMITLVIPSTATTAPCVDQ